MPLEEDVFLLLEEEAEYPDDFPFLPEEALLFFFELELPNEDPILFEPKEGLNCAWITEAERRLIRTIYRYFFVIIEDMPDFLKCKDI